jgi:hypothetical protein
MGPKKFTKNISVFQSKLSNDTKSLGTSHCWAKKLFFQSKLSNDTKSAGTSHCWAKKFFRGQKC